MTAILLLPRQCVRIEGAVFKVVRRTGDGRLVLEDVRTLAPRTHSDAEIAELFSRGALSFVDDGDEPEGGFDPRLADFTQLPERLRSEARRREAYVRAATKRRLPRSRTRLEPLIREVAAQLGDANPPSAATLCRWLRRWDRSGGCDVRALVPAYHARGNRTRRLPREVVDAIDDAVSEVYLRPERLPARAAWHNAVAVVDRWNQGRAERDRLPLPSERAVSRRIAAIDRYELVRARYGRRAAEQEFGPVGACPPATRPLEVVEIDHTKLDDVVVDQDGVPLGRPWLTAALDRCTRALLGVHVGFEPPSALTVANCLRNAILPKDYVKKAFPEIKAAWPCCGIPETIVVDNGPEFHSQALEDACAQLGIGIQYAPVASPWFKGKVERWFGTVARSFAHQIPGTTFSSVAHRGDYDSERRAAVSFEDFVLLLHHWIIECYIREPHAGIRDVPLRLWECGTQEHPVRLPKRIEDLDALLGGVEIRRVSRKGIELHGLLYNGEELRRIRTRPGAPADVKVRFDPADLGQIRVLDPATGAHVTVPAVDAEYAAGLTLAQHKAIRRLATERVRGYVSIADLCRTRDDLRRAIDAAASGRRRGTRARVARFLGLGSAPLAAETAIQEAAEFMGEAPEALRGTGTDSDIPVAESASHVSADRMRRQRAGAPVVAPSPKRGRPASGAAAEEEGKADIDLSALGIEVVSFGEPGRQQRGGDDDA